MRSLALLSEQTGVQLMKGASARVEKLAGEIAQKNGPEWLEKIAKLHFKTTERVLNGLMGK